MNNQITCKVCGSKKTTKFTDSIRYCTLCNNYFRVGYSNDIYKKYKVSLPMPDYFDAKNKARHHVSFLKNNIDFNNVKSILEIGPGDGIFIKEMRKYFPSINITVIEPGIAFRENLEKIPNVRVLTSYIEECVIEEKFDLIIMSHILEHLKNPMESMITIYNKWLSDNGYLYIDIPNSDYELRTVIDSTQAPEIHLTFFSPKGILNFLKILGFKNEMINGNIYSTLMKQWIKNSSQIAKIQDSNKKRKIVVLRKKLMNRFLLLYNSFISFIFNKPPKEKSLSENSPFFNNIAIIAKKH